ncbi:MAG TPA: ABC transporter ATP-binding protein [Rhodoblastus sp.]|nr:ABC transporter ATP-binding protein [Rhodoblastus sp.]
MSLLAVERLSKSFGGVHAVADVTFSLEAGEMLAIIGPNGAGKSTCFNMINGQLRPDGGRVLLDGRDIVGLAPHAIWRMGVGRTFQVAATFSSMNVLENVQLAALSHRRELTRFWRPVARYPAGQALDLLAQVGMADQAKRPCSDLAYGDVKRVELAIALANDPKLLLMDEPTAGMAPGERIAMMTLTRNLARQRSMGVLFTEHSMDAVFGFSDRLLVLARGKLIAQGTPQEVRNDPAARSAYFGSERAFEGVKP